MMIFENKLVAVLNESIEPGKLMNALAHICIGFGAYLGKEVLRLMDYQDADGNSHTNISDLILFLLNQGQSTHYDFL